jgi:hypothetical protein
MHDSRLLCECLRLLIYPVGVALNFYSTESVVGARGGVVVKAVCYKPAGHGFNSRWCHSNFSVT